MADERLSSAAAVAKGLREKLDVAAVEALQAGHDWAEGPAAFKDDAAEVKAGPMAPGSDAPAGWKVIRNADWVAAGKPGLAL